MERVSSHLWMQNRREELGSQLTINRASRLSFISGYTVKIRSESQIGQLTNRLKMDVSTFDSSERCAEYLAINQQICDEHGEDMPSLCLICLKSKFIEDVVFGIQYFRLNPEVFSIVLKNKKLKQKFNMDIIAGQLVLNEIYNTHFKAFIDLMFGCMHFLTIDIKIDLWHRLTDVIADIRDDSLLGDAMKTCVMAIGYLLARTQAIPIRDSAFVQGLDKLVAAAKARVGGCLKIAYKIVEEDAEIRETDDVIYQADMVVAREKVLIYLEFLENIVRNKGNRTVNLAHLLKRWFTLIICSRETTPDICDTFLALSTTIGRYSNNIELLHSTFEQMEIPKQKWTIILELFSKNPRLLTVPMFEIIFVNMKLSHLFAHFVDIGFAEFFADSLALEFFISNKISMFIQIYAHLFDMIDIDTLQRIADHCNHAFEIQLKSTKKEKSHAVSCGILNRYLAIRRNTLLDSLETHTIMPADSIVDIEKPALYGKANELIFNESLTLMHNISLAGKQADDELDATQTQSSVASRSLKFTIDSSMPAHKQILMCGQRTIMASLTLGFTRINFDGCDIRSVLHLTDGQTAMKAIEPVEYARTGIVVCTMNNTDINTQTIAVVNLRVAKVLSRINFKQDTATPQKFYNTDYGIVGLSQVQEDCVSISYLNTKSTASMSVKLPVIDMTVHGSLVVVLSAYTIDIYRLHGRGADHVRSESAVRYMPFKKAKFIAKDTLILASRFYGSDVIVQLKIKPEDVYPVRYQYYYLNGKITEEILECSADPFEKYTRYFILFAKDRMLYAAKIDRALLPYSGTDPYSRLRLISLKLN